MGQVSLPLPAHIGTTVSPGWPLHSWPSCMMRASSRRNRAYGSPYQTSRTDCWKTLPNGLAWRMQHGATRPVVRMTMECQPMMLESGQKERARAVFRKAKSFKTKGAGLEEKILEQVRSTTKLIDRLHARRRRATKNS